MRFGTCGLLSLILKLDGPHRVRGLGSQESFVARSMFNNTCIDHSHSLLFFPSARSEHIYAILSHPQLEPSPLFSSEAPPAPPRSHTPASPQATQSWPYKTTSRDISNPSHNKWISPRFYSDLTPFNVTRFASGRGNLQVVAGGTPTVEEITSANESAVSLESWSNSSSMLQLFYPEGSINPSNKPKGGAEFYAAPLSLAHARNVSFAYSVFFPSDFEWVKGGKLPGIYGGHTTCSGGDAALDCFSTRMMWRAGGDGELYLYAPKDRQTQSLCNAPPMSVCDADYGLSIARGSFKFARGSWTHLRQTVVLNTPGVQDGGFLLEINGRVTLNRADVFYRDKSSSPTSSDPSYTQSPAPAPPAETNGDGGLLGLLDGLFGPRIGRRYESSYISPGIAADASVDVAEATPPAVGFKGIFFSTFFGGHETDWASPKDQLVWFKDFSLSINDP